MAAYDSQQTTLAPNRSTSPASRYTCPERFEQEMALIHRRMPVPWLHATELASANNFRQMQTPLGSVLFTRDEQGVAHAFHNICRHRGARLVEQEQGRAQRHVCPYHAWSYDSAGALVSVPARDSCFPDLELAENGLYAIPCVEAMGLVWLCPGAATQQEAQAQLSAHLASMEQELQWLDIGAHHVFSRSTRRWRANWKLLSEGGLETYHFKTAHRDTIGPYFPHNLSLQDTFGLHSRVIMPSEKISRAADKPLHEQHIRDFTHILYGLAPQSSFLVQENHVDWIRMTPLSLDETEIAITTLVPGSAQALSDKERAHWQRNVDITLVTLDEDFMIAEGIQQGLATGAATELHFGRNEGLLQVLNDWIEQALAG